MEIDNEIITYKSKTSTTFEECVRGFSGIIEYESELLFQETNAQTHTSGSSVVNLSVVFLQEFFRKLKVQITPGFEDREFYEGLNQRVFIKQAKDFYSSKGTEHSFEILFRALYGKDVEVLKPRDFVIEPSTAEYRTLKFLEHWMEFIGSGSGEQPYKEGYYFRMRYPDEYKTSQTKIVKFDRNYVYELEYNFFGMFPIAMNSIPVTYGTSEILKVSASFFFDRYVSGKITSASVFGGNDNNKKSSTPSSGSSVGVPVKGFSGVVFKNQSDALNPNAQTYYDIQLTNPTPFPEG